MYIVLHFYKVIFVIKIAFLNIKCKEFVTLSPSPNGEGWDGVSTKSTIPAILK